MGVCKKCGKEIPDGMEVCDSCSASASNSEAYLDSLLNSVRSEPAERQDMLRRKKKKSESQQNKKENDVFENKPENKSEEKLEDILALTDVDNMEDMEGFQDIGDLDDIDNFSGLDDFDKDFNLDDISFDDVDDWEETEKSKKQEINNIKDKEPELDSNQIDNLVGDILEDLDNGGNAASNEVLSTEEDNPEENIKLDESILENQSNENDEDNTPDQNTESDQSDSENDGNIDNELMDYLNFMNFDEGSSEESADTPESNSVEEQELHMDGFQQDNLDATDSENEESINEESEKVDLENMDSGQDMNLDSIMALDDVFSSLNNEPEDMDMESGMDMGDILSDTLGAVSSRTSDSMGVDDMSSLMPDAELKDEEQEQPKKKKGLLAKLFGNVKDEKTAKKNQEQEEEKANKKQKKNKKSKDGDEDSSEDGKKDKSKKAKKEKVKKSKEKKVKEKKVKEKKAKEADAEIEDEGRINKVGAAIVFLMVAALGLVIIKGSASFSSSNDIKDAKNYFKYQKYDLAYDKLEGSQIKEQDSKLYKQIATIMRVNKELDSYRNYYKMGMYPEALDSLLKGLKRYDKYMNQAETLGVKSDLDLVRSQIIKELQNSFDLSEKEATNIYKVSSQEEYSKEVIKIASGN